MSVSMPCPIVVVERTLACVSLFLHMPGKFLYLMLRCIYLILSDGAAVRAGVCPQRLIPPHSQNLPLRPL